jgi:hypothetical protein
MAEDIIDRIVNSYEWDGDVLVVHGIVSVRRTEYNSGSSGRPFGRVVPQPEPRDRRITDPEEQQRVIAAGKRSGGHPFRY